MSYLDIGNVDEVMLEAIREVDALTPGSEPMGPSHAPSVHLQPWWRPLVQRYYYQDDSFQLIDRLGGKRVTSRWLELNRGRIARAIQELE